MNGNGTGKAVGAIINKTKQNKKGLSLVWRIDLKNLPRFL